MPEHTTVKRRRKARRGARKPESGAAVKVPCAFCKGKGKDPFGVMSHLSTCQVCGGRGEVRVRPPTAPCKFCKGSGVHPYSAERLTCSACKGRGVVTAIKDGVPCPVCGGSGIHPLGRTMAFACARCGGQGVVPKRGRVQEAGAKSATTAAPSRTRKKASKARRKSAQAQK
jgi:DnaJ-class molecular chaperone